MALCHGGPGAYDYLKPVADMVDDLCFVLRYDQRGGVLRPCDGDDSPEAARAMEGAARAGFEIALR